MVSSPTGEALAVIMPMHDAKARGEVKRNYISGWVFQQEVGTKSGRIGVCRLRRWLPCDRTGLDRNEGMGLNVKTHKGFIRRGT